MWLLIDRYAIIIGHSIWDSDSDFQIFWGVIRNLQISANTLFRGEIRPGSLRIEIVLLFLCFNSDWRLNGKIHPWIHLHCYVLSNCDARSNLAMGWHKLFFGYPTSLNLQLLLQLQLLISCISLNAFWQLPDSEGDLVAFSYMFWQTDNSSSDNI